MPSDLTQFGLAQMLRCSLGIRRAASGAATFEDAAVRMNDYLYDHLRNEATGTRQVALSRIYKTHPYRALEPAQRAFADSLLHGTPPDPNLQCLCLMATRGEEDSWNSRHRSRGHLAIPLVSTERIEQAPMIASMIRQFGLDAATLVNPTGDVLSRLAGKTYRVFHVEEAMGNPAIPAQQEFVARHGIRSVVGFGGALPSGAIFAAILFSRVHVAPDVAERFRGIALDAKSMLFPFDEAATFSRPVPTPA